MSQRAIGRRFGGRLNFEGELEAVWSRLGGDWEGDLERELEANWRTNCRAIFRAIWRAI